MAAKGFVTALGLVSAAGMLAVRGLAARRNGHALPVSNHETGVELASEQADAPTIRQLATETIKAFLADDCMPMAAGIAYFAMFSIFPLLLGLIALFGMVLEPAQAQAQMLTLASRFFPGSFELVSDTVQTVMASREQVGLISIVGLLWSASGVFGAIRQSLNRAWDVDLDRGFLQQKLVEFGMAGVIGVLLITSIAATAVLQLADELLPPALRAVQDTQLWAFGLSLVSTLVSALLFALMYRYVPNATVTWGDVWWGAAVAAVLFEIAKLLFAWYLATFANYAMVYGPLATVIALLFWTYLSSLILLFGAELAAEYTKYFGSGVKAPKKL